MHAMNKQAIGSKICTIRKQLGMTQKQLAEKLHVTDKSVSKWERGAAIATVTGQLVAGIMILFYFTRFKTFTLTMGDFVPQRVSVGRICALGVPAGAN